MAIYHLSAQIVGKGGGRSAVAAAAYRHCAKMERQETAEEIDYSRKGGNAHSEFALPEGAPNWIAGFAAEHSAVETSAYFWNAVEAHETRKDAQLMREIVLALPVELSLDQNIDLVRDFVRAELTSRRIVADWAYHDLDGNPHVHLMTSLRPLTEEGFGAKRVPIIGGDGEVVRGADGKIRSEQFTGGFERLRAMREAWAELQNHHLAKHGHDIRVDHRSFEDLGIEAVPSTHRGPAADAMDARGEPSELMTKAKLAARENYLRYAEDPSLVLKKITTQKAVFTRHDLAREIHRTECSAEEFQALFYHVGAHEELVPVAAPAFDPFTGEETTEALFSTRTMVELEHRMVQNIEGLVRRTGPEITDQALETAFDRFAEKPGFDLTDQQKMVARHLTGERGAAALVGYAGAGKSTAIDATRMALEARGYTVVGGALAGIAADNLRSEAGVESRTLASWEYQWAKGAMLPDARTVFIMDEAGMVSSRQMESITRTLNEAGATMIVLGDARQLQPIQAGAAFRAFVDVTGYAELDSVVRQSEPWMREAAIAFGSGDAQAGVTAYLERDRLAWTETEEDARAALVADWMPYHRAGADITIMAHRNKDVIALNVEAREKLKASGVLGEDHVFASERGEKPFATGDRVLFLQNERSLGVFNESTGEVVASARNRLEVLVDGHADPITLRANEYNHIDHGYARTIHKEQGNTVDRAFVYLSPTMDAQLSYVALTRHRDDVTLYASREGFRSRGELVEQMTRDRLQDSTALYRDGVDHAEIVRGFAERRGFPTTQAIVGFVKANVQYLRERFDKLSAAFDRLRRPPQEHRRDQIPVPVQGRGETAGSPSGSLERRTPRSTPPEISPLLNQSMHRLAHNLVLERRLGRKAEQFARSADYELNTARTAAALRGFNADVRALLPREALLAQGMEIPDAVANILASVPEDWRSFLQENWEQVFAAQWAETQATLQPLTKSQANLEIDRLASIDPDLTKATPNMPPEKPLIDAVPNLPDLIDRELRGRAAEDLSARPSLATARDIAGRIYANPDPAVDAMVARYAETGDRQRLLSEIERSPETFGDLRGGTRLGIANAERRSVLEQAPMMARQIGTVTETFQSIEGRIAQDHEARRQVMARPVPDLSPEAVRFLQQVAEVHRSPAGPTKDAEMRLLMSDKASVQEVGRFQQALTARYGRSREAVEMGLQSDPGFTQKPSAERQQVQVRVQSVMQAMPVIGQMREHIRQQDRSPELGQEKSRGIER